MHYKQWDKIEKIYICNLIHLKTRVENLITKINILTSVIGINQIVKQFAYLCSVSITIFNGTWAISAEAWTSYLWTTHASYVICLAKKVFVMLSGRHKDIQVSSRQRTPYNSREVVRAGNINNNYDSIIIYLGSGTLGDLMLRCLVAHRKTQK